MSLSYTDSVPEQDEDGCLLQLQQRLAVYILHLYFESLSVDNPANQEYHSGWNEPLRYEGAGGHLPYGVSLLLIR